MTMIARAEARPPLTPDDAAADGATGPGALPHNVEAEQQLLGALLTSNEVLDRIEDLVKPAHFYDPVHGDIFELAASRITGGLRTDATTLKNALADHAGLGQLGGAAYLLDLQASAIATAAARDYAQLIHDLAVRRQLIELGRDISETARQIRDDSPPDTQIAEAEKKLYDLAETGTTRKGFQSFLRPSPTPSTSPTPPTAAAADWPACPRGCRTWTGCWAACTIPIF